MAVTRSNINYSGKELGMEIVRESFDRNVLHEVFGARIMSGPQGGKSEVFWFDTSLDLTINGAEKCPSFNSNYNLNQNSVLLCEYSVSGEIPNSALVGTARELRTRGGALNESVTQDVELYGAFTTMLTEAVSQEQGDYFLGVTGSTNWSGETCNDPLLVQFEDTTLANPVPTAQKLDAPSAITASNVQTDVLDAIINALPAKYRYRPVGGERPKIAVSAAIADAYLQSLTYTAPTSAAGLGNPNVTDQMLSYRGYQIVVLYGLADDRAFMTFPSNIGLVFDDINDMTALYARDGMLDSTLCASTSWRLDWRAAAFFGLGDKIVYMR